MPFQSPSSDFACSLGDLCVTFYRMKEFSCLDPDGHMLTFGQETDEPPTPEE